MEGVGTSIQAVDVPTCSTFMISPVWVLISMKPIGTLVVLKEKSPVLDKCPIPIVAYLDEYDPPKGTGFALESSYLPT